MLDKYQVTFILTADNNWISTRGRNVRVHYEAPPAARVPDEMARFLEWVLTT